jgi:hypothetical protein
MKPVYLLLLVVLISTAAFSQQLPSQVQAKRGVFTERLFLKDRWIDKISTDLNTSDSTSHNVFATGKAVADYNKRNNIQNQFAVAQPANLWIQGKATIGSLQVDSSEVKFNTLGGWWDDVLVGAGNNGALNKIVLGNNLYFDNGNLHAVAEQEYVAFKYVALISQESQNNPIAHVLERTPHGEIVWTRNSTGNYTGTLTDAYLGDYVTFHAEASDETGNAVDARLFRSGPYEVTLIIKNGALSNTDGFTNISIIIRGYIAG